MSPISILSPFCTMFPVPMAVMPEYSFLSKFFKNKCFSPPIILPVGTLRVQSLDIQNFSRQGVSPTRFQFWNLEGEAEKPDHVLTLMTDKLTECLPLGLVVCDVPDVVVAEAAHGHVPELDVGASEAETHVVQAERVKRRQPP